MYQLAHKYFVHLLLRTTVFVYSQLLSRRTLVSGGSRGRAPGASPPPLLLDQTEARRAEKLFVKSGLLRYLRVWMTAPPLLPEGLDPPLHLHTNNIKNYVYCLQLP